MRLETFTLRGNHVVLDPLSTDHVDALADAASIDRASYGFTNVPEGREPMQAYVESLLAEAGRDQGVPFVQRCADDGRIVGCTRYLALQWAAGAAVPSEVEIGGTWLAADVQRTALNTEAKRLLLGHAFDEWSVQRVAICTDERNERSRRAIERLGATFEGVLRNHRVAFGWAVAEGVPRQTAVYSIIDSEWPTVRRRLEDRLRAPGDPS
jgi:RimJ/RimL family protein N-acetyltransferase